MTLSDEEKNQLIGYRLKRSQESEKEARLLLKNDMYSAAVNRIYYGMYYALAALALKYGFKTTKHSQWKKVSIDSYGLDLVWPSRFEVHVTQVIDALYKVEEIKRAV